MKYAKTVLELIGNTPLVRLNSVTKGIRATVLAKVEFLNPGGSVKDRIGVSMLLDAEKKGLVKPGATIVEPTSGNTGMGLALVACLRGYRTIFVMPDKMSKDKELQLRALGAEVVWTPTAVEPDDPRHYCNVAERIVRETPGAFSPNQYSNPSNPLAHYETTGPEIWRDTGGKVTHFVAGVGTGGTISGTARFLKEKNPKIQVIGADPEGSIYYPRFYRKKEDLHLYKTEGIGEDFIPGTVDFKVIDEIIRVTDKEAFTMTRRLVREEGLLAGGSSGTAVHACLKVARKLDKDALVVVLLPDSGRSYLRTIFNDEWMRKEGFL